jgi:hypothetical protein
VELVLVELVELVLLVEPLELELDEGTHPAEVPAVAHTSAPQSMGVA